MTNNTSHPSQLLTIEQVAQLLGVSVKTVRRMMARGDLPEPIRFNARLHRWHPGAVQRWLDDQLEQTSVVATRRTRVQVRRR